MASKKTIKPVIESGVKRFCLKCGCEVLKQWGDLTEEERFIAVRRGFQTEVEPTPGELFCSRCLTHIPDDLPQNA